MKPELIVCIGGMYSGKTTKLLYYLDQYKYQNKKIIAFKPKIDNRYSSTEIVSHAGWKIDAKVVETGYDVYDYLRLNPGYDVVGFDELFMCNGISDALIYLYTQGKTIIVATLNLSSEFKSFEEVNKILPYATIIDKCYAVCSVCFEQAHYSFCKTEKKEEILIGATNYEARCLAHYPFAKYGPYSLLEEK